MRYTPNKIPQEWLDVIQQLPDYDPLDHAEGYLFDTDLAQKWIDFFGHPEIGCIRHIKGPAAGELYVLDGWDKALVANLVGWVDANGVRRYRKVFLYIPRKNSKSSLAAGILAGMTFIDGEKNAENYCCASDRDQALAVYQTLEGMIRLEPALEKRCQTYATSKTVLAHNGSFAKAVSGEAGNKHGTNPHCAIIDELHVHPNAKLLEAMETGQGARMQPVLMICTTADHIRESVCNDRYKYACSVRDNKGDKSAPGYSPNLLPVIFESPTDADWHSEDEWARVNPNLGKGLQLTWLREQHQMACELPSFENEFKRLHLNMRTESSVAWLPMDRWDKCDAPPKPFGQRPVWVGLDLSSTRDVSAIAVVALDEDDVLDVEMRFYMPQAEARAREERDAIPYGPWSKRGLVTLTEGNSIDYDHIIHDIGQIWRDYKVQAVVSDPWNATHLLTDLCNKYGIEAMTLKQGFWLSGSCKELEKRVLDGTIRHGGNPILRWMAANTVVRTHPDGHIKPDKEKSGQKIDGIVALAIAMRPMIDDKNKPSVYRGRGFLTL